jgi:hypothetical protein
MSPTPAAGWPKPVDVGTGSQSASFGRDGRWLSLGAAHRRHGYVELSNAPDFDESRRGDPDHVRRYRAGLAELSSAFLVVEPTVGGTSASLLIGPDGPHWSTGDGVHDVTARCSDDGRWIEQRHSVTALDGRPGELALTFSGSLRRASFAEITEVAPPPAISSTSVLRCSGNTLVVIADDLGTTATIDVAVNGDSDGWQRRGQGARLVATSEVVLDVVVRARLAVGDVDNGLDVDGRAAAAGFGMSRLPAIAATDGRSGLVIPTTAAELLQRVTAGAIRYTLGCCVCRVAPGEAAILTDHRLLPLSWTRDAYFQALLLLSVGDVVPVAVTVVADHLRWLWHRARQPGAGWMRAHYAHGGVKDPVQQADQELYPLLELVDFRRIAGAWPRPPVSSGSDASWWGERVAAQWERLPRHAATGLLASTENPADDALDLPLILSTQILWWYTARWLASFADELGLDADGIAADGDLVRNSVPRVFSTEGPVGPMWAYAADGARTSAPYADANDLPTALAPLWGFCRPDDPSWVGTMRFACGPDNPGYARGPFGGLGSRHTPGTWPLGDLQEWIAASMCGERDRAAGVLARVGRVAAPDGLLPESYDPHTARWRARHWFAWPAAAFGVVAAVGAAALDLAAPSPRSSSSDDRGRR